jgi:hypothetical protein
LEGIEPGDKSGYSVAGVGDFDGDGLGDLIVGAYAAAPGGRKRAGASYLVFGRRSAFGGSLKLASLDGRRGFVLNGIAERDASARSVASAGDFNGDGLDDVVIGAFGADADGARDVGEAYVVFGRERPRRLGCAAP